jgi:hypothetical protein
MRPSSLADRRLKVIGVDLNGKPHRRFCLRSRGSIRSIRSTLLTLGQNEKCR